MVKNPPANARAVRDMGSIPGSGRSPGGGHGNPLQYSCLDNHVERKVWWATVHGGHKELGTTEPTEHAHSMGVGELDPNQVCVLLFSPTSSCNISV